MAGLLGHTNLWHCRQCRHGTSALTITGPAALANGVNLELLTLCAISGNTLRAYLKLYQAGGMEALKQLNFYRPQSLLSEQRETLEAHLRAHPPHTINEAISVIEALTGIRRSPTQIRVVLKRLGLKCLKVGLLPAKGDPEEQEADQEKKLEPPLSRSRAGERAVFFVDAAHFVFGAFLGYLWCFARCWS